MQIITLKWRVKKNHIEQPVLPTRKLQPVFTTQQYIGAGQFHGGFLQSAKHLAIGFDYHHLCRTARCSLQSQHPAAREQIKTALAMKILPQPVEQGLTNTIRRGAQTFHIREFDPTATMRPPDNAHPIYCTALSLAPGTFGSGVPTITVTIASGFTRRL